MSEENRNPPPHRRADHDTSDEHGKQGQRTNPFPAESQTGKQ